jgi:hypothetical protein
MAVQVNIDFYRVEMPDGCTTTFESVVDSVHDSPDDPTRNVDIRGHPVRLQVAHFGTEYVEGDMLLIQMHALPPKANLAGEVESLQLASDEGLGNETAFLYHPPDAGFGVAAEPLRHKCFGLRPVLPDDGQLEPADHPGANSSVRRLQPARQDARGEAVGGPVCRGDEPEGVSGRERPGCLGDDRRARLLPRPLRDRDAFDGPPTRLAFCAGNP